MFYSTGQVARELKVTTPMVRRLCEAGVIKATASPGGHWQIDPTELERLKRDGLPPIPRGAGKGNAAAESTETRSPNSRRDLLAAPSQDVVRAAEEAVISDRSLRTSRNQLEQFRIRKEATELQDFFDDRERRQAEQAEAARRRQSEEKAAAERRRQAERDAERRRRIIARWVSYAVDQIPYDAPRGIEGDIRREVAAALASIQLDSEPCDSDNAVGILANAVCELVRDDDDIRRLVGGVVAQVLAPWKESQERQKAITQACESLPYGIRYGDAMWKERARGLAADAVQNAPAGIDTTGLLQKAELALRPLIAEFEHAEKCERALGRIALPSTATWDDREEAKEAARESLRKLPVGASDRQFAQTVETALQPIRERIAARQSEREQRQARATAESEQDRAREAKQRLVELGLGEIYSYAGKLLLKYEFDPGETAWGIERRVKPEVEKALRDELDGTEGQQFVIDRVRALVKELA